VAINYAVPWVVPEVSKAAKSVSAGNTTALKDDKVGVLIRGEGQATPGGQDPPRPVDRRHERGRQALSSKDHILAVVYHILAVVYHILAAVTPGRHYRR
jgi:hypothetical protein